MTCFLLLNPDFFFDASGPAQKAAPVPFFGVVFMTFFFPQFFFLIPEMSSHVRKPQKPGALYREADCVVVGQRKRPYFGVGMFT